MYCRPNSVWRYLSATTLSVGLALSLSFALDKLINSQPDQHDGHDPNNLAGDLSLSFR